MYRTGAENQLEKSDGILPGTSKFVGMGQAGSNTLWNEKDQSDNKPNFAPKTRRSSVALSANSLSEKTESGFDQTPVKDKNGELLPDISERTSLEDRPSIQRKMEQGIMGKLLNTVQQNQKELDPK